MNRLQKKILSGIGILLLIIVLTSCNLIENSITPPGKNCKDIAILLPEVGTATRYEELDRPLLEQEISHQIPGVKIRYFNAKGDITLQAKQVQNALRKKVCMLIIDPVNSQEASVILEKVKNMDSQIPIIAYDRLIFHQKLDYYISFDSQKVGEYQGEYIKQQLAEGDRGKYQLQPGSFLVIINGDRDDHNAPLLRQGLGNILDPILKNKGLILIADEYIFGWKGNIAQAKIKEIMDKYPEQIRVIAVANDDMAHAIIQLLGELKGKILITGQDGSFAGLINIIKGDQSMTVYKPIIRIAKKTGELVGALYRGEPVQSILPHTIEVKNRKISTYLASPLMITESNIQAMQNQEGFPQLKTICHQLSLEQFPWKGCLNQHH